jgi:hypothetical protein
VGIDVVHDVVGKHDEVAGDVGRKQRIGRHERHRVAEAGHQREQHAQVLDAGFNFQRHRVG